MTIAKTKLIRTGQEELVSLPPEVHFGRDVELTIVRSGDVITLTPYDSAERPTIKEMIETLRAMPRPSEVEVRDPDIFPDRPNLYR